MVYVIYDKSVREKEYIRMRKEEKGNREEKVWVWGIKNLAPHKRP